jgi:hypothetical protein
MVGDELVGGAKITAKLVLEAKHAIMYKLDDILVSGTHQVKYNRRWIHVSKHPEGKIVVNYNEPYLYCLNTTTKRIVIGKHTFSDWDEIFKKELAILKKYCSLMGVELCELENTSFIHKYFDIGFDETIKIELKNGIMREIKDICVGDILRNGEFVYGLVDLGEKRRHLLTDPKTLQIGDKIHDYYNSCVDLIFDEY